MYIKSLYIESFGSIDEKSLELEKGLNVIEGKNESGKSTLCMFIKFMLYGLSGRSGEDELSERAKYISWKTGKAAGHMIISTAAGEYKIERSLISSTDSEGQTQYRESLEVTDTLTGERAFKGQVPGEAILGFPEGLFVNTVFVRQISGSRVDGSGMAQAIENILLAGDENANIKKAMDRLEKARKALWHKRGEGGKLQLALREKARLEGNLSEARSKNAGIISYENECARLSSLIDERTAQRDENQAVYSAYEKLKRGERVYKAKELEDRISALSEQAAELEQYGNISAHVGRINSFFARLEGVDSRIRSLKKSMQDMPDEKDSMSEEDILSATEDKSRAASCKAKKKLFGVLFAVCLLIGSALGAAGALVSLPSPADLALMGAGGAFLAAGIVFISLSISKNSKLKKIFAKWNADSIQVLGSSIDERIKKARAYESATADIKAKNEELSLCEKERDATLASLRKDASVFIKDELSDTDLLVSLALEKAQELSGEKEQLLSALGLAKGEMRSYADVLGEDGGESIAKEAARVLETPEGKKAALLSKKDAELILQKRNFAQTALPALITQKGEADAALARLKATTNDSATIAALLDSTQRDIEKMKRRLDGIEAARDALILAGEGLRSSLMPRVCEKACDILSSLTDGKYTKITLDREFDIDILMDGKKRELAYMSKGTADAVYISLRLALASVMFANDTPPLIYDESFAGIDETRLEKIIALLSCSEEIAQSLLFTCRSAEGDMAKKGATVITL